MLPAIALRNHPARIRIPQGCAQHVQSGGCRLAKAAAERLVENEPSEIVIILALLHHRSTFRQTPKPVKPARGSKMELRRQRNEILVLRLRLELARAVHE